MALPLPPDPRPPSEPLSHPPGAPRELDIAECIICSASEEEAFRPEQAQKLGQDSLDPLDHFQGGLRGAEPATSPPRLPTPSSREDSVGGRYCEHLISGREVFEAEQESLDLCLFGLGLQLRDLDRGLGPMASAQSGTVQLQALQADLRGAAESVGALLTFSEGLAQRHELLAQASREQVLSVLRAQRHSIFQRLWRLQAKLVSHRLVCPTLVVSGPGPNPSPHGLCPLIQVSEEADWLDQDLEAEGDLDGPGPGGVWGPWAPGGVPIPAELEWDPAGDVGGLGPWGRRAVRTPGAPCELCGHRGPQGRGQDPEDVLRLGLSHRKHLPGHRRRSLIRKPQDKKRQAPPSPQDVMLEVDPGAAASVSRWPLTFLLIILFFLLVAATLLLPMAGGLCCSHARLARTPYLVLSYVSGPPPT
ncbi:nesprin-4 [Dugong dugon]